MSPEVLKAKSTAKNYQVFSLSEFIANHGINSGFEVVECNGSNGVFKAYRFIKEGDSREYDNTVLVGVAQSFTDFGPITEDNLVAQADDVNVIIGDESIMPTLVKKRKMVSISALLG